MKTKETSPWFIWSMVVIASLFLVTYIFTKTARPSTPTASVDQSTQKALSQKIYMENMLLINYKIGGRKLADVVLEKMESDGSKHKISILELFKQNAKPKFIIRYSTIGCNTCVNLLFKNIEFLKMLGDRHEVIVFVDFDNRDDFIMWKKTSEIKGNIYWLPKGKLDSDDIFKESSYCFVLDREMKPFNYFKPDNQFSNYVKDYVIASK